MGELAEALARDDHEPGLQGLVDAVAARIEANAGLIATLTADRQNILVRARFGPDLEGRRVGDVLPLAETAVGEAIMTGRTHVWSSLADSPASSISSSVKGTVGPMIAVPLAIRGQRFGTFAVARFVGSDPFTARQARLVEAYAVQAAINLEFERVRSEVRLVSVSAERDRIGRDLHERVIQLLFGVAFALQALDASLSDDQTRSTLQAIVDATDRAIRDLRRVVFGLGPGPVAEPSLDARLTALAADNARLQAEIETQLEEVRASRSRIIAAGDAERKRVERDLHDGAQQRLVSLTLALRLARSRLGDDVDPSARLSLDQASAEAKAALAELRELARGIHPQILTEAGLEAAIESLAARASIKVTLDVRVDRLPPAVEGAAYFLVSEALANVAKHAAASRVDVRAQCRDSELRVEITDDGIGGADASAGTGLRGLGDRLASLSGTLEIVSPAGAGTTLRASIPGAVPLAAVPTPA